VTTWLARPVLNPWREDFIMKITINRPALCVVAVAAVATVLLAPFAAQASTVDEECFDACYDEAVELCHEDADATGATEEECDEDAVALCEDECREDDPEASAVEDDDPEWDDGVVGLRPPEGLATTCRGCASGGDPSTTLGAIVFASALFALRSRGRAKRREINR
jgi:hypothetical protein